MKFASGWPRFKKMVENQRGDRRNRIFAFVWRHASCERAAGWLVCPRSAPTRAENALRLRRKTLCAGGDSVLAAVSAHLDSAAAGAPLPLLLAEGESAFEGEEPPPPDYEALVLAARAAQGELTEANILAASAKKETRKSQKRQAADVEGAGAGAAAAAPAAKRRGRPPGVKNKATLAKEAAAAGAGAPPPAKRAKKQSGPGRGAQPAPFAPPGAPAGTAPPPPAPPAAPPGLSQALAQAAATLRTCWRTGCSRTFRPGEGDADDARACGQCEHFPERPSTGAAK